MADLVRPTLSKPERAIRGHCNSPRVAKWCWENKFADGSVHCDAPNLVPSIFGKPERAIWCRRNPLGIAEFRRDGKLGEALNRERCDCCWCRILGYATFTSR